MTIPPATQNRPHFPSGTQEPKFNFWQPLGTVLSVAIIIATLFNFIAPSSFFSSNLEYSLSQAIRNQANPRRVTAPTISSASRIGIVAGHWGSDDGFICSDGQTEGDVNLTIATYVRKKLMEQGYTVDLLKEFDSRLQQYNGLVLVSIHSGSCEYIDNSATGFKAIPSLLSRNQPEQAINLVNCLTNRYAAETGLRFINDATAHMTSFHSFDEVNPDTPVVVIEVGFLNLDREFLNKSPEKAAQGIMAGILCYVRNESSTGSQGTP